jgi:hypothetical protein
VFHNSTRTFHASRERVEEVDAMADKDDTQGQDPSRFEGEDNHGWATDVGPASDAVKEGNKKAWEGNTIPGPEHEQSEEERAGVGPTDTEAQTPLGVGESTTRRGEDVGDQEPEEGREDRGTKGESERPYGTSSAAPATGVDPQEPVTDSPNLTSGDQGG